MKSRRSIYWILISVLIGGNGSIFAANYYEVLGVARNASRDAIFTKCEGLKPILSGKQRLEDVKGQKEAKEDTRKRLQERRGKLSNGEYNRQLQLVTQDITSMQQQEQSLEKEIDRLIRAGRLDKKKLAEVSAEHIEKACEVLLNPQSKAQYDQQIGAPERRAQAAKEAREKEAAERKTGVFGAKIAGTYYEELRLPKTASGIEIKERCDLQRKELFDIANKKKIARGTARTQAERQNLDKEVKELEKKISNTNVACQTLLDPKKKKKYDSEIAEPRTGIRVVTGGALDLIRDGVKAAKKESDKLLVDLVGEALTKIPIPNAAVSLFNQKLAMRDMSFVTSPSGPNVRTGLGFTGTMFFNNMAVKGTMYVVEDENRKLQYALSVALPETYKISSMFPRFKKLDMLSLPQAKLVVSSFDYTDLDGFSIKRGLNLASVLDLTGPLKMLGKLKDRALKDRDKAKRILRPIVFRTEPIRFQGVIPVDIQKAEFSAAIPMRIGIDFTKIPKMPRTITKVFKEFTTDDLEFAVTVVPTVAFKIETGVRLVLGTQAAPIRLSAFGIIEPTMFSLGMRMREMLQLYFLALGNVGIQIDWDDALAPIAAALGIPFTGIGLNGQIDVGKPGESRAVFKLSGGARVRSGGMPDIVLEAEANNIRFADILKLLIKIAAKTKVIPDVNIFGRIPVMTLERVRGYLALEDTTIAGRRYDAGFALEADAFFLNKRAGFSIDLKHTTGTASGSGYISNIDLNVKGKPIFRLSGPSFVTRAGQQVEGPAVDFAFSLKEPSKGRFGVRGAFEVPAIDLRQSVDFVWQGWNLRADFESTYAGFTVVFGAQINLKAGAAQDIALPGLGEGDAGKEKLRDPSKKWEQMYLKFGFKGGFAEFLTQQARPAIDRLKQQASAKLGKLNEEVGNLSRKVSELGRAGVSATEAEIQRTRARINDIQRKIDSLRREQGRLKKVQLVQRGKLTAQIKAQQVAQKAQEVFLGGLLKPGKAVISGTSQAVASVTKALHEAQLLKRGVEATLGGLSKVTGAIAQGVSIFQVKEAIGEFSSADILAGKLPRLISLKVETNIPGLAKVSVNLSNIQFDFKQPVKSVEKIVEQIFSGGVQFSR